ncbi:hypothetical protein B0H13DRAFT_1626469, partial [Mycena leptocephala]
DDSDVEVTERLSIVVKSKAAWRKQMVKWQEELREEELQATPQGGEEEDGNDEDLPSTISAPAVPRPRRPHSWFPITLKNLFGGNVMRPIGRPVPRARVVTDEGLYMELLAAEHSDEEPDAGALEGSGDDYDG